MKKKILVTLLMVLTVGMFIFTAVACGDSGDKNDGDNPVVATNLEFQKIENKEEYAVVGIGENIYANIIIPSEYDGLPVTEIGERAFRDCEKLTSVTIPESVTSIGEHAFSSCGKLTSMTIPDSVTSIGDSSFRYCYGLTSVVIGSGLRNIGFSSFDECYKLVEVINKSAHITVENGSTSNGYVGYYALAVYNSGDTFTETKLSNDNGNIIYTDGEEKILVGYNGTGTDLILPNYITKINDRAFIYCEDITSVIIPNSVTNIGYSSFYGCDSLKNITIPDSVTSIGYATFRYCRNLTSVSIPNSVTSIGDYAFCSCTSLKSIIIPNSVTSIGTSAFRDCFGLTSVTIPENVASIGQSLFLYCLNLKSVVFEDTSTWYRTISYNGWQNKTGGEIVDLTNPSRNEEYLGTTEDYYWYKI